MDGLVENFLTIKVDFFETRGKQFLQLIGWTPLIELKLIANKDGVDARIVGKMEAYQPLCSVKDRSALRCY